MNKELLIVSSHFNENLTWLKNQEYFDYLIYSKNLNLLNEFDPLKIKTCVNKGNEASSYLSYIIENYDDLPNYVAFIHGHLDSYHQSSDILTLIKNYTDCDYQTLNRKDWFNVFYDNHPNDVAKFNWGIVIENYDFLNLNIPKPRELRCTAGAQFIVSKNLILRNPIEVYKNALSWLEMTTITSDISGRVFEHLWNYIFTHKEIETHC